MRIAFLSCKFTFHKRMRCVSFRFDFSILPVLVQIQRNDGKIKTSNYFAFSVNRTNINKKFNIGNFMKTNLQPRQLHALVKRHRQWASKIEPIVIIVSNIATLLSINVVILIIVLCADPQVRQYTRKGIVCGQMQMAKKPKGNPFGGSKR